MKQLLLFISIIILNLSASAQVLSKFSWNGPSATTVQADLGPNAASVSSGAVINVLGVVSGVTNGAISPGPTAKDIDLTLPNTSSFNVPGLDIAVDFRREESEASFLSRGSVLDFGMNGGKLFVKFNVENGFGGNTTINSGNIFDIPNDHLFHNYRFIYDNTTGIANLWADGVVKYTYLGTPNRAMYWTGAGSLVIGKQMDATGRNIAVLDNFELRTVTTHLVLPLRFTSFTAIAKNAGAQLNWSTANETSIKSFVVERSFDGISFEPIKTVQPKGSASSVTNAYEAVDASVTRNVSYRIRSTDLDGKVSYSDIKTVGANSSNVSAEIVSYPNPAANVVNLKFNNKEAGLQTYNIYTQDGRKVQSASQSLDKGVTTLTIQLTENVPHNAFLVVVLENKMTSVKETARIFRK